MTTTHTDTHTDTRETLLAAYDAWRAERDELERREAFGDSPFSMEWDASDDAAAELVGRMGRWLCCLRTA